MSKLSGVCFSGWVSVLYFLGSKYGIQVFTLTS